MKKVAVVYLMTDLCFPILVGFYHFTLKTQRKETKSSKNKGPVLELFSTKLRLQVASTCAAEPPCIEESCKSQASENGKKHVQVVKIV